MATGHGLGSLLRRAIVLLASGLLLASTLILPTSAAAQTDRQALNQQTYDVHFQRWATRWMPEHDWRWLKAQCFQESRLNARALSPAGAMGICQIMPGTARDLGVRNPYHAQSNIAGGARYMRRMLNIWHWERTDHQRLELAQASYNAGVGNILRAQRLCGSPVTWIEIAQCLPQVTGRHATETRGYVPAIDWWFELLTCPGDAHEMD